MIRYSKTTQLSKVRKTKGPVEGLGEDLVVDRAL